MEENETLYFSDLTNNWESVKLSKNEVANMEKEEKIFFKKLLASFATISLSIVGISLVSSTPVFAETIQKIKKGKTITPENLQQVKEMSKSTSRGVARRLTDPNLPSFWKSLSFQNQQNWLDNARSSQKLLKNIPINTTDIVLGTFQNYGIEPVYKVINPTIVNYSTKKRESLTELLRFLFLPLALGPLASSLLSIPNVPGSGWVINRVIDIILRKKNNNDHEDEEIDPNKVKRTIQGFFQKKKKRHVATIVAAPLAILTGNPYLFGGFITILFYIILKDPSKLEGVLQAFNKALEVLGLKKPEMTPTIPKKTYLEKTQDFVLKNPLKLTAIGTVIIFHKQIYRILFVSGSTERQLAYQFMEAQRVEMAKLYASGAATLNKLNDKLFQKSEEFNLVNNQEKQFLQKELREKEKDIFLLKDKMSEIKEERYAVITELKQCQNSRNELDGYRHNYDQLHHLFVKNEQEFSLFKERAFFYYKQIPGTAETPETAHFINYLQQQEKHFSAYQPGEKIPKFEGNLGKPIDYEANVKNMHNDKIQAEKKNIK